MSAKGNNAQKDAVPMDPFEISPSSAELALTMLKAKEPDIICKTLKALSIFSKQHHNNKVLLYNLDAISYILPHIDSPQFNVKRLALLNLGLLCLLPETPERILKDPETMKKLAYQLVKAEDIFTLEYASLCISRLTTIHEGCQQLIDANILDTLCKRMDNLDLDVQMNCVQTLSNLLEDPLLLGAVTKNSTFSWASLLVLTRSKIVGIQNAALKVVGLLVSKYDEEVLQTKFRASTGVKDLCDILERYEFHDIHVDVLNILQTFVGSGENARHLYTAGCIPKLQAYLDMALPKSKTACLHVLTTMSFTPEGRDVVYATNTDLIFCDAIVNFHFDEVTILGYAAEGIANMCAIVTSAVRMCDKGVAVGLCSLVQDDSVPWFDVRINTLKALVNLCRLIQPVAVVVLKPETFTYIRSINLDYKDHPEEAQILALQCYLSLLNYNVTMTVMLDDAFVNVVLGVIRRVNIKLQLLAIKVMSIITKHDIGKDLFTHCIGEKVISDKLRIHHNGLRSALCQLIIDSATYEGAEVYVGLGTITYLSENLSARYTIKLWEKALGKILRMHPSAKFGHLGRLDIEDVTFDGFYVLRRLGDTFPSISSIMIEEGPGINPVYIALLHPQHHQRSSVDPGIRTPYQKSSRGYLSSISISNRNSMAVLPHDNNLKEYLNKLRHLLGDPRKSLHYVEIFDSHYDVHQVKTCDDVKSNLKKKAQLLAEFVVREMSGCADNEDGKCGMPNVELHIAELMNQFKTNVIGIGFVRYGGALERAIMYKVLADKLGIPCALYRKCSGYAWCAIAVPEITEPLKTEEKYPAKYLRVNYVVNLNDSAQDRLHLEGGLEANKISGPPSLPPYVVGKRRDKMD